MTTASAQTRTPLDRQVFIILLSCSGLPCLECSLQLTGWQTQYQGFSSPFSGCSKSRMASEGGKTFTPRQPALPIISHQSAISSQGHPNISMMAPFCPFLKLPGWFTVGWFQVKSTSSIFNSAILSPSSYASTRTDSRDLKLLGTKVELDSDEESPKKYLRVREEQAGLTLVTTVTLAPPLVQTVRAYPTKILQSWQLSLHRGSPLGGVWKARLAHVGSLSVCWPRQAFSLSKLLQESVSCLKEKAETVPAVSRSRSRPRQCTDRVMVCNKSYINNGKYSWSVYMTIKVNQFIKHLRSFGKIRLAAELSKMGIHIRQRAPHQQMQKIIDTLNPEIVIKHINRRAQQQPMAEAENMKVHLPNGGLVSFGLSAFHEALTEIHQNYLNQQLKYATDPPTIHQQAANRQRCRDQINSLLGVTQEIRLDPKRISHLYQQDVATLTNTIFPSFTDKRYLNKPFTISKIWMANFGKNTDSALIQKFLLIIYGLKKERQFQKQARDYIQDVLYPVKPVLIQPQVIFFSKKNFIYTFVERQRYNQTVLASIPISDLATLVGSIKKQLRKLKIGPIMFHRFTLAFSDSIVRIPSIFTQHVISNYERAVLWQVCDYLKAFRVFIKSSADIERSSQSQFFQILASYNSIKHHVALFSGQVPKSLLLELGQREWHNDLLLKVERLVDQVGVSALYDSNIIQKFTNIKITVEFLVAEEVDATIRLFENLLFTIRSGIEWLKLESKKQEQEQNPLFVNELQEFFDMRLCSRIIKLIFMGEDTAFNLQIILDFFWQKFLKVEALKPPTFQTIFLLINITTRYKCTTILKDHQEEAFHLLSRTVQAISSNDQRKILRVEVVDFLKEQAAILLEGTYRQTFLQQIESSRLAGKK